jgi:hypothetical protein
MEIYKYLHKDNFYKSITSVRKPTQGDIIIPYKGVLDLIWKKIKGVIIITNECDIEQKRAKYITFLPIYKITSFYKNFSSGDIKSLKKIIKLNHSQFFFLPPHEDIDPFLGGVISFQNIQSEKIDKFYQKNPTSKLSLKRPYLDRLCLKVSHFFNRIPINHPKTKEIEDWIDQKNGIINCLLFKIIRKLDSHSKDTSIECINQYIKENYKSFDFEFEAPYFDVLISKGFLKKEGNCYYIIED